MVDKMNRYWFAANYLCVGQIYLSTNPLLNEPLKRRANQASIAWALGHFRRTELHLCALEPADQRTGCQCDLHSGPGHGGPSLNAHSYLEGTYSECITKSHKTLRGCVCFFASSRRPAGFPVTADLTFRIRLHEGGELGYSLLHAFGAAFDNPDLDCSLHCGRRRGRELSP